MKRFLVLSLCCWPLIADGAERRFPYEAVVHLDETEVRSGPGSRYYATAKLNRDDHVTVHRHDPGGWYMIAPPADSFSWIRAEYVDRLGDSRGELNENNVVVRVGSSLTTTRDVEQRRLTRGDLVEILAEETLNEDGRTIRMYKIKPPRGEYRWIDGRAVVPEGERPPRPDLAATIPGDNLSASRDNDKTDPVRLDRSGIAQTGPDTSELISDRQVLHGIDDGFREMVQRDPSDWNLEQLVSRYEQLSSSTSSEVLKGQIATRLEAIERYRKVRAEFMEFVKLTTETSKRDQELKDKRKTPATPVEMGTPGGPFFGDPEVVREVPVPETPDAVFPLPSIPLNPGTPQPAETPKAVQTTKPVAPLTPPATLPPGDNSGLLPAEHGFSGAGIVQRNLTRLPNTPPFVLVAPDTRILAFLVAGPGVDLNRYIGQSVGVRGDRGFHQPFRGDRIVVESLQPVRLQP